MNILIAWSDCAIPVYIIIIMLMLNEVEMLLRYSMLSNLMTEVGDDINAQSVSDLMTEVGDDIKLINAQ